MSALPLTLTRFNKLLIPFQLEIYINSFYFHILCFCGFKSRFCHIHWFYPCRSFRHSNWWRHKKL